MKRLRFAVIGTGFWCNYQIPAWQELNEVELVAVYNRTADKADVVAKKFGVPAVYTNVEQLLDEQALDFIDIITNVETHKHFTLLAAGRGIDVICQKPMAPSLEEAREMVEGCRAGQVRFFVHENFRFQAHIRALKDTMQLGVIVEPFKARVSFCSPFPVFDNQPFLAELDHFILTDIGSHILDICRFLFGDAKSLTCLTRRVNKNIRGEDVADVMMEMQNGLHCFAEMSYASILEKESFPQTLVLIEGDNGSLHLTNDFELKITTRKRTTSSIIQPKLYHWVDPDYAVVHSSIVDCNKDILKGLQGGEAETTGDDNYKTVQLVWAAYESAASGKTVYL